MNDPAALAVLDRIEADLAELRGLLAQGPNPQWVAERPIGAMLAPCQLTEVLGLSESQIRRLCERGLVLGVPGIERRGNRWFATAAAMRAVRA